MINTINGAKDLAIKNLVKHIMKLSTPIYFILFYVTFNCVFKKLNRAFSFVYRKLNRAVHNLAKFGVEHSDGRSFPS